MKVLTENDQLARVEALDSARGWAILGVIAIHISQAAQLQTGILHTLAINGDMGVELFYVLSAFSLMMVFDAREGAGRHSLQGYFIRRFFRIAPMFWIVLLLSVMLFFGKKGFWAPSGVDAVDVGLTMVFLHGVSPESVNAVVPGGWSVAVEVMFYLMLPLLFKYARTARSATKWLLGSMVVYYGFGFFAQDYFARALPENARYLSSIYSWYMSLPAQLPVFIMGILAFHVVREESLDPVLGYVLSGVGAALLLCFPISSESPLIPRHLLWGIVFAALVASNVLRPIYLFDNPLLRTFGRISYSAYLLHFIVLMYIGKIFRHAEMSAEIKFVLLYFVVGGITYFLASWTYRKVELRYMKVGSEFSRRFEIEAEVSKKESYAK